MKVKCINKYRWLNLTIGKIYKVIEIDNDDGNYYIIDEYGPKGYYPKYWFKPLSEIRNERIDKLLE
jgi:hypothetical protein